MIVALLLSGCSITRVEERPCEGPHGELELKAIKGDGATDLKGGYAFHVSGDAGDLGWHSPPPDSRVLLQNLEPGRYQVRFSSARLKEQRIELDVKPGSRTSLVVLHRNVRRLDRAEDIAATTGKVILYTVGAVVYAVVWCLCEVWCGDDEDDDCPRCHHSPCRCAAPPPPPPKRFNDYKKR